MKRIFVSAVCLTGCVAAQGDESFIIRSNLAVGEGGACFIDPSLSAPSIARGQITLDAPIPYLFHPLLESRIVAADGKESLRTIFMRGANVDLSIGPIERIDANGAVTVDEVVETTAFASLFSTPLPPNGGLAAGEFDLIPLSVLAGIQARVGASGTDRIHAQVIATTRVFGDYYGDEIESSPFQFPITVCTDCVIGNRPLPGESFPLCAGFAGTARPGNSCNPFQDGVVDCCDNGGGQIQCPAIATAPMD